MKRDATLAEPTAAPPTTRYPTLDEVLTLHSRSVKQFGGHLGIRDIHQLESALAMPKASYGEQDVHERLEEKAAAYAYHIVRNQPFFDGNKRTALAAALWFLRLNGVYIQATDDEYINLALGLGSIGYTSKSDVAVFFGTHIRIERR